MINIIIGNGTLVINRRTKEAGDGVSWFKLASPSLLREANKNIQHCEVCGSWIVIAGWLVWFVRTGKVPVYRPVDNIGRLGRRIFRGKFNES